MSSEAPIFPALANDAEAIEAFVAEQNAATEAAFMGDGFEADVARVRSILEDPTRVGAVTRRALGSIRSNGPKRTRVGSGSGGQRAGR